MKHTATKIGNADFKLEQNKNILNLVEKRNTQLEVSFPGSYIKKCTMIQ